LGEEVEAEGERRLPASAVFSNAKVLYLGSAWNAVSIIYIRWMMISLLG
jgi:hypothetical protein